PFPWWFPGSAYCLRSHSWLSCWQCPVVDETDGDWTAGDRPAQPLAQRQWRAALERCRDRVAIVLAHLPRCVGAGIGHPWGASDLATALEGKANRHLHAGTRLLARRRHPAVAQSIEH